MTHGKLPSVSVCGPGRRPEGFDDPLERNLGTFRGLADCGGGALELAEHDFVLGHQDRAEIADVQPATREVGNALSDPLVECVEIVSRHTRPEALRNEARFLVFDHATKVRAVEGPRKRGLPYEMSLYVTGCMLRSSMPAAVRRTLPRWMRTSPSATASSHTVRRGRELFQASIVCAYVRSRSAIQASN